ncbi:MAG: ADOP family duplicated permease [Longimicrobiales bacterium]
MAAYRRRLGPDSTTPDDPAAREVDAEIEAHLAMRTDELVAQGWSEDEARAEAVRRFGGGTSGRRALVAAARRTRRRRSVRGSWAALRSDVGLALRHARRAPGFSVLAVLIFAAGVGLTTSMFTVADHVLLRPLPYPGADRLVALWSVGEEGGAFPWVSMSNWVDWKERTPGFEATALYRGERLPVATDAEAFHAPVARVGGPFFATLRTPFVRGRPFSEEEAQSEAPVAVVSEGFWTRVLGAPASLNDVRVEVDGVSRAVVGVVPDRQSFPAGTDLWLPERYRAGSGALRNNINYEAVARLGDDASPEQVGAQLDGVARDIRTSDPEALYSWGVSVRPLRDVVTGGARSYLVLLAVSVGFLLIVACANLAGLSLARARRRQRETAVHLALGAGRGRIVRRVVTEHLLLALAGGSLGVAVAWLTTDVLLTRLAAVVPRAHEVGFDLRVAAFGIAAAAGAGILAGIVPALRGSRGDLSTVLSGARGDVRGGRGLPGAVMVGTEVALAVALLVAGGLLFRSLQAVVSTDLGFDAERVMAADMTLAGDRYADDEARAAFWSAVGAAAAARPGVETVATANPMPMRDGGRGFIDLPDREGEDIGAGYYVVGERYFDVLDVPLLEGRSFEPSDAAGTERVAVINRSMARRFWPGGDALGRRVRARSMEQWVFGTPTAPWITVVGVVEDTRQYGFESDPDADMFVLDRQVPYYTRSMSLMVEGRVGAELSPDFLRSVVREVDPSVAVQVTTLQAGLEGLTEERRLVLSGLGLFGGASVLLVCLGIYGLMSFAAGERTREMAVRVALGAERGQLVGLMLVGALKVVLAGAAAGLVGAWLFTRLLESFLVDVRPADPTTYALAVVLLTGVALAAALVPSLRAARRDPLEALRAEA